MSRAANRPINWNVLPVYSKNREVVEKQLLGSDYAADLLRGAVVDIAEDGSYLDFLFTAG